jgi:hypothetical protein
VQGGPLFLFSLVPYLEAQSATIRGIFDQVESRMNNHTGHRALTRGERIKDRISLLYCWISTEIRTMSLNERMMVDAGFGKKEMLYC